MQEKFRGGDFEKHLICREALISQNQPEVESRKKVRLPRDGIEIADQSSHT